MAPSLIKKLNLPLFLLVLIILIGGFFRFYNLNWDEGQMYHPDERNIALAVSKIEFPNQLNPGFFAYNSFSIYLYKGVASFLSLRAKDSSLTASLMNILTGKNVPKEKRDFSWAKDWSKINLIGRFISALAATLSIYLIYLLGLMIIGKGGGLVAAGLFAFSPGLIQQAHFGVTESLLIFFLLLLAILSVKTIKQPKPLYWILMAVISGLAIGTKTIALSFLIIPLTVWSILVWKEHQVKKYLVFGFIFLLITFLVFFLVSPHTILNFSQFRKSMDYESGVVSGKLKVPYNWQFNNTLPYLFFFSNLHWQTGLFVPTLGFLGIFLWLFFILKKRERIWILPLLIFSIFYFAYVGSWYTKFIRYMLPLIPTLILGTAWFLLKLTQSPKLKLVSRALLALTLIFSFLWSLAFLSIYQNPTTRIVASQWIYENIPQGSTLLVEHWDDRLPSPLPRQNPSQYSYLEMKNYEPDTPGKISSMAENLADGDFLILSSRRLSGSIGKNPEQWPITSQYYEKLFREKLGYRLVKTVTSYPKLLNIEIKDDQAEETFQVYDHPIIHIFQNTDKFSKEKLQSILVN